MHSDSKPLIEGFRRIVAVMVCHAGEQSDANLNAAMDAIEEIIGQARQANMDQIRAAQRAEIAELRAKLDATL